MGAVWGPLHDRLGKRIVKGEDRGEAVEYCFREALAELLSEAQEESLGLLALHEQGQEVARPGLLYPRADHSRSAQGPVPQDRASLGSQGTPPRRPRGLTMARHAYFRASLPTHVRCKRKHPRSRRLYMKCVSAAAKRNPRAIVRYYPKKRRGRKKRR